MADVQRRSAPEIAQIVVARVYSDLQGRGQRELGKFVVIFDPAAGRIAPSSVAQIRVTGPGGYTFPIRARRRYGVERNGYMDDGYNDAIWYMAYDTRGYLAAGTYTVEVLFADGTVRARARELQEDDSLIRSYLEYRQQIERAPSGLLPAGEPRQALTLCWTTLAECGGVNAYYSARLFRWLASPQRMLIYHDDIFAHSAQDPRAGFNRSQAQVTVPLRRYWGYTWFTEIVDSNRYAEIDCAVFMPACWFITR